jgi:hypothetical protein
MPSVNYQDYNQNNPITSAWLNAINKFVYGASGNNSVNSPIAWVRFNGSTGAVVQSSGVSGVVRNSAGNYTITYATAQAQAQNVYQLTSNLLGFSAVTAESIANVTVQFENTLQVATDPTTVCLIVFGTFALPY